MGSVYSSVRSGREKVQDNGMRGRRQSLGRPKRYGGVRAGRSTASGSMYLRVGGC